jgi:8-oxo-dGTP diphosphatase
LRSGYRLRTEIAYVAYLDGGEFRIDPLETLEARWFAPNALPHGMQGFHKLLIEQALALPTAPDGDA